jgi:alpha-L-fucosidase
VEQLEETGQWLKINGEGIYGTRARDVWKKGNIYFTRSKDKRKVFAFVEKWPGTEIIIPSVTPQKESKLYLLGYPASLKWSPTQDGVKIFLPDELQLPENRPCKYAWGFQFDVK